VHATGQVAHLDVPAWPADVDAARINRALPDDVRVTRIDRAPDGFDARFAAVWRRYAYRVCDDGVGPDPLQRHLVLAWPRPLDVEAMTRAAQALLGEHDFSPFCKARPFATTVRAVQRLDWTRDDAGLAVMRVQADAFCHSMVRALVGVLLPVGDGRRPESWPGDVLRGGSKDSAVTTMPAYPLVLEEVGYPPDDQLRARQAETRSLRSLGE
jgi:tRNA pseudouridine38-40 synthase